MYRAAAFTVALGALGLAGCVSQADLIAQERRLSQQINEQRKQIQSVQREVERLRNDMEGGPRTGSEDRIKELESRLAKVETPPSGETPPSNAPEAHDVPPPVASAGAT